MAEAEATYERGHALGDTSRRHGMPHVPWDTVISIVVRRKSATRREQYTNYRARVMNDGAAAIRGVTATLVKHPRTILMLDTRLTFGDVPAGGTVTSQDTFTLLRNRHDPFTATDLVWTFHGTPVPVNTAPVARAGPDQTVQVGQTITLDGGTSTDVDGNPLTYQWAFVSVPVGSLAVLNDPTLVRPTFTVDRPGSYHVQLIVHDGKVPSTPDFVTITTQNSRPVADAGPDQTVFVGDTVQLDGRASTDADGHPLSYSWSLMTAPPGSLALLANFQTAHPSFLVYFLWIYVSHIVVHDGQLTDTPKPPALQCSHRRPPAQPLPSPPSPRSRVPSTQR